MRKENVLVVETEVLLNFLRTNNLPTQGFIHIYNLDKVVAFIDINKAFYSRKEMENNPKYKQIIPYVLIVNEEKLLLIRRTQRQSEKRLHNKFSIGVGGHINDQDRDSDSTLCLVIKGMKRELKEELYINAGEKILFCGLINDDTDDVGKYHLALVFIIRSQGDISIKETEKMTGEWIEINRLNPYYEQMENWSKVLIEPSNGILGFYKNREKDENV